MNTVFWILCFYQLFIPVDLTFKRQLVLRCTVEICLQLCLVQFNVPRSHTEAIWVLVLSKKFNILFQLKNVLFQNPEQTAAYNMFVLPMFNEALKPEDV